MAETDEHKESAWDRGWRDWCEDFKSKLPIPAIITLVVGSVVLYRLGWSDLVNQEIAAALGIGLIGGVAAELALLGWSVARSPYRQRDAARKVCSGIPALLADKDKAIKKAHRRRAVDRILSRDRDGRRLADAKTRLGLLADEAMEIESAYARSFFAGFPAVNIVREFHVWDSRLMDCIDEILIPGQRSFIYNPRDYDGIDTSNQERHLLECLKRRATSIRQFIRDLKIEQLKDLPDEFPAEPDSGAEAN